MHTKDLIAPTGLENKRELPSFPGALPRANPRTPLQGSKRIQPRRTIANLGISVLEPSVFTPQRGKLGEAQGNALGKETAFSVIFPILPFFEKV